MVRSTCVQDVVAVPLEQLMRRHADAHVEVAGRAPRSPGPPLPDTRMRWPVVDARRDLHGDLALRRAAAGAPALRAGLLDDLPGPGAPRADPGLDELAQHGAADRAYPAAAAALGAGLHRGGVGRPRAFTGRGRLPCAVNVISFSTPKAASSRVSSTSTARSSPRAGPAAGARRRGCLRSASAEGPAEEVLEEVAETGEAVEAEAAGARRRRGAGLRARRCRRRSRFSRVAEHLVGLGGLLELLLACRGRRS